MENILKKYYNNWIKIWLNKNSMELKRNEMHIGGMYCKFARDYGVGKKTSKKAQIHKDIFPYLFTCPSDNHDLWDLKLSYRNKLWWIVPLKFSIFV